MLQSIGIKWVCIGCGLLVVVTGGVTAVISYNRALSRADTAESTLKQRDAELSGVKSEFQALKRRHTEIEQYYHERGQRTLIAEGKRRANMAKRSVRDEKGNISVDNDPVLAVLRGLFPAGHSQGQLAFTNSSSVSR